MKDIERTSGEEIDVFADTTDACKALAMKEPGFARALDAIGAPHIRRRPGGFEALFRIIVEQQVSVPSAQAIWARCKTMYTELTPDEVAAAGADVFRECGLSGPKIRYVMALADDVSSGALDLAALTTMDDAAASIMLQKIKGIGPWTAAIYLLFCEGRTDVWPPGDVALLAAWRATRLRGPAPEMKALDSRAPRWRPYRGLAAHILWTYYAHLRGRKPI